MMRVRMLMVDNDVHDADIQRMMTQVLKEDADNDADEDDDGR